MGPAPWQLPSEKEDIQKLSHHTSKECALFSAEVLKLQKRKVVTSATSADT